MRLSGIHPRSSFGLFQLSIAHLEMLNILAATRIWENHWANSKIAIACDNEVIVNNLTSDRTRDLTPATIAGNIQFQETTKNVDLKVIHASGKLNLVADLFPR